jgi:hypothetical protein
MNDGAHRPPPATTAAYSVRSRPRSASVGGAAPPSRERWRHKPA